MNRRLGTLFIGLSLIAAVPRLSVGEQPSIEILPKGSAGTPGTFDGPSVRPGEALSTKPIDDLTTNIDPTAGELPEDVAAKIFDAEPTINGDRDRGFGETLYFWEASNLAHKPLYFEQAYVERYGYNYRCLQPVVSGVEFYTDVAALPIKMAATIRRPYIYALGPARPGTRGTRDPRW